MDESRPYGGHIRKDLVKHSEAANTDAHNLHIPESCQKHSVTFSPQEPLQIPHADSGPLSKNATVDPDGAKRFQHDFAGSRRMPGLRNDSPVVRPFGRDNGNYNRQKMCLQQSAELESITAESDPKSNSIYVNNSNNCNAVPVVSLDNSNRLPPDCVLPKLDSPSRKFENCKMQNPDSLSTKESDDS